MNQEITIDVLPIILEMITVFVKTYFFKNEVGIKENF